MVSGPRHASQPTRRSSSHASPWPSRVLARATRGRLTLNLPQALRQLPPTPRQRPKRHRACRPRLPATPSSLR
eukprot:2891010-Prymnesium_polylepis.1